MLDSSEYHKILDAYLNDDLKKGFIKVNYGF